jgi:hypothetical protein
MTIWDLLLSGITGAIAGLLVIAAKMVWSKHARAHRSLDRYNEDVHALLNECVRLKLASVQCEVAMFKLLSEGPEHHAGVIEWLQTQAHFLPPAILEHAKRLGLYAGDVSLHVPQGPHDGVNAAFGAMPEPEPAVTWVGAVKQRT